MKTNFTEKEVANIVSLVGNMVTCKGNHYQQCYKYLCDYSDVSSDLAGHIMTVIQQCRKSINL